MPCHRAIQKFNVAGIVDLNLQPRAKEAQQIDKSRDFSFHMLRSGFVPGENLDFSVKVTGNKCKKIKSIRASLYQMIQFRANGSTLAVEKAVVCEMKACKEELLKQVKENCLNWSPVNFKIPTVPATILEGICHLINIQYLVRFTVKMEGLGGTVSADCPVLIGTIPIQCNDAEKQKMKKVLDLWNKPDLTAINLFEQRKMI